jgi:hypothetical protein
MDGNPLLQSRTLSGTHAHGALLVAVGLLLCPALVLRADEIYKSVDSEGHVVYSDRIDSSTKQQTIVLGDPQTPPAEIHFCWTNCFTLVFDHGVYTRADGSDETWTVQWFTSLSVRLLRHDAPVAWNGFSNEVPYEGKVEHGRLTHITVAGKPVSGVDMAWGMALNTLPGSNTERDQLHSTRPTVAATTQPAANVDPTVDVDVRVPAAPPLLPNEEQPPGSAEGYLWTPGYWSWGGAGYFWVPGGWVQPPRTGVLWTPGYWAFEGGFYVFHHGYWGPHVGYYGGINYGAGYGGVGYTGGRWVGNAFAYNRAVNNVNAALIHNTYNEPVLRNNTANKVSYHGGPGGTTAAPVNEGHPITASQRSAVSKAAPPIAQPNVVDTQSNTKSTRAPGTKPAQHPRP